MVNWDTRRLLLWGAGPVVAMALGAAVFSTMLSPTTQRVTLGPEVEAVSFEVGDAVTATGDLVQLPNGRTFVCILADSLLPGGSPDLPRCSPVAVPVAGLDVEHVPGAQSLAGGWFALGVRVSGLWDRYGITVTAVVPAAEVDTRPQSPCEDEGDGAGLGTEEEEQALLDLGNMLAARPDRFVGVWRARSDDHLGRIVVGAVGDIEAARLAVRAVYPFSVCVVVAKYSTTDLSLAASRLPAGTHWLFRVDPSIDGVRVSVGVLDEATRQLLEPHGDVILVDELLKHR